MTADCLAGAFTKQAQKDGSIEDGDIDEAFYGMSLAGDPTREPTGNARYDRMIQARLARQSHGTKDQRTQNFRNGLEGGAEACLRRRLDNSECLADRRAPGASSLRAFVVLPPSRRAPESRLVARRRADRSFDLVHPAVHALLDHLMYAAQRSVATTSSSAVPILLLAPFVAVTVAAAALMSRPEPLSSTPAPTPARAPATDCRLHDFVDVELVFELGQRARHSFPRQLDVAPDVSRCFSHSLSSLSVVTVSVGASCDGDSSATAPRQPRAIVPAINTTTSAPSQY